MATIIDSLNFYKQNPSDPRGAELNRRVKSGALDEQLKQEGFIRSGNEIKKIAVPQETKTENGFQRFAEGAIKYTPGGQLAKGIASAISINRGAKDLEEITASINAQNQQLIEKIREGRQKGQDVSNLLNALKSNQAALQGQIDSLDSELKDAPTGLQVAGAGLELAAMAVPAGVAGSPLKKSAVGGTVGYLGDVATNMAEGDKGAKIATPGIGAIVGAGLPLVGAGTRVVSKIAPDVAQAIASKAKAIKPSLAGISETVADLTSPLSKAGVAEGQIAKALKLAPVEDLARIEGKVGKTVIDKMTEYDLIKGTRQKTEDALREFSMKNYELKNDAIMAVEEQFSKADLPEIDATIDRILAEVGGASSDDYVKLRDKLKAIKAKDTFDLADANYVRASSDNLESLYTKSGEVRNGVLKEDAANVTNKIRGFVDDRVAEVYPDINIREVSNNIMFGREMADAITRRGGKFATQADVSLGDLFVLGVPGDPLTGAALLATRKVVGSSPIRLRIANMLTKKGTGQAKLKKLEEVMREELKKAITAGDDELVKNLKEASKEVAELTPNELKAIEKAIKEVE